MRDLVFLDAVDLARRLADRQVSAVEVLDAHLRQIEKVNPAVNAFVTLAEEEARAAARASDCRRARGDAAGVLEGLPVGIKDTHQTRGLRTTFGSLVHEHEVPEFDALIVERVRAAGGVILGKTNTPEFAAGCQTYNRVFGATTNPFDRTKTAGGSSGGSAAAVACGMAPLADGSDFGGSLRNPASFCGVVGLRSSPGRVPKWPAPDAWDTLAVPGPIARSVRDAALFMSAVAGPDPRSAVALQDGGDLFGADLAGGPGRWRVAVSEDLGAYPVEAEVRAVFRSAVQAVEHSLDVQVRRDAAPDLSGADGIFHVLRAARFAASYGRLLEDGRRKLLGADVVWNIQQGLALDGLDVARAQAERTLLFHRARRFFEEYDVLLTPTTQVAPFSVDLPYPTEIEGRAVENYLGWMGICYAISVAGLPAISVPAGFTAEGLPVGLQVIGGARKDLDVLRFASAFERIAPHGRRRPPFLTADP